ncbi:MAG TPA: DUF4038 domain-containing protein [Bacilli bacterium]
MKNTMQNRPVEWTFISSKSYPDPFNDVELGVAVTEPDGKKRFVHGFWAGGQTWKVRYASPLTGTCHYKSVCSDPMNADLHDRTGSVEVVAYQGDNPLYLHGPLRKSEDGRYVEHSDGKPFFWLADTWWMGLSHRMKWPEDIHYLAQDRMKKGFNVIQLVAGLNPDMSPFDDRGANEAGFPWNREYTQINPAYFDMADRRIEYLVESGLMPCIVGCWGFYLEVAGKEAMMKHWNYLSARYGAYPIFWCLAGEAVMPFYTHPSFGHVEKHNQYAVGSKKGWTEITKHLKERDPFHRPLTIHPTDKGHEMVEDAAALLDLDMLQTGHGSVYCMENTISMVRDAVGREPRLPVLNSEVCYEGLFGSNHHDTQRVLFWSCLLSGACGHSYGANGIWQVNRKGKPYGSRPGIEGGVGFGSFGNTPWDEASQLLGSTHMGLGRKLFERYRWWAMEPHPEWVDIHADVKQYMAPYAAGIPGEFRVFFLPVLGSPIWEGITVRHIEPDVDYRAYYYDPMTGESLEMQEVAADAEGNWQAGRMPVAQDWVLVLERI